ncbi:CREB-binding protein-like [Belonocnema kinseyi]|uniref:CREB-binding protein-like n=1 Tax=Belonocnema kinseyi TaxID=2817044 RepID=UPI00143E07E8|nr:CREB-binding protein-like [Belonocnema kinseyi]XP_033212516.1 CREB-binding protein-like [Belonocnema kinseyi]
MGTVESRLKGQDKDGKFQGNYSKSIQKYLKGEQKWANILDSTMGWKHIPISFSVQMLRIIQHHLTWISHAKTCQNEKSPEKMPADSKCVFKNCITMKKALKHIESCKASKTCPFSHCYISKRIIHHLETCEDDMCPVCLPTKSECHRKACELLINIDDPLDDEQILLSNDEVKSQKKGKEWHKTFRQESRDYIVYNLTESTISIASATRFLDLEPIIPYLIAFGKRVETFFYALADSKLEYCQNIEKIIKAIKQQPLGITLPILGQCLGHWNEKVGIFDTYSTVAEAGSSDEELNDMKRFRFSRPIELRKALLPTFEKLNNQEPESLPFRKPVDPEALEITDYLHVVNKPMDLLTIKHKLDILLYTDPWEYVDDVWIMLNNAWIYNPKTSRTYRYCTKLSEIFEQEMDCVMKSLGFCCGRKFTFNTEELSCYAYGKHICTIPRNEVYHSYQEIYNFCEKCFNEIPSDIVLLGDDPPAPQIPVKKEEFELKLNNGLKTKTLVYCKDCKRKVHSNCVKLTNEASPLFTCDGCLNAIKSLKDDKIKS